MKKVIILGLVLLMVIVFATTAFSKAQKVDLILCTITYPDPNAEGYPPGGGFVIFNNSSGVEHNFEFTVSLKGVVPNTPFDIYLFVDGAWYGGAPVGTVTSNEDGNVNFHMNVLLEAGEHTLAVDVTWGGVTSDVYETPDIHDTPMGGTVMIFE